MTIAKTFNPVTIRETPSIVPPTALPTTTVDIAPPIEIAQTIEQYVRPDIVMPPTAEVTEPPTTTPTFWILLGFLLYRAD